MVSQFRTAVLQPGEHQEVVVAAYCMNSMCMIATGQPLYLTQFFMRDEEVLATQASVWQHFDQCFNVKSGTKRSKKKKKK